MLRCFALPLVQQLAFQLSARLFIALLFGFSAMAQSSTILTRWRLDGDLLDSGPRCSANGPCFHATTRGTTRFVDKGADGQALEFGRDGRLILGDPLRFVGDFTFEVWFFWDRINVVIAEQNPRTSMGWRLYAQNGSPVGSIAFCHGDWSAGVSCFEIARALLPYPKGWYHAVFTRSVTALPNGARRVVPSIYLNGSLAVPGARLDIPGFFFSPGQIEIGSEGLLVDDIVIHQGLLSAAEIRSRYEQWRGDVFDLASNTCRTSQGRLLRVANDNRPQIGRTFTMTLSGGGANTVGGTVLGTAPLSSPIPLGQCLLHVQPSPVLLTVPWGNEPTTSLALPIPFDDCLFGRRIYLQAVLLEPQASQVTLGNSIVARIGTPR